MNNLSVSHSTSLVETTGDEAAASTEAAILKKNPKIDLRLLEEYERLVAASGSGARSKKKGADYNIAHPLSSKDRATDAYHRGQSVRKTGR